MLLMLLFCIDNYIILIYLIYQLYHIIVFFAVDIVFLKNEKLGKYYSKEQIHHHKYLN